jgi:PAS domain S-box-containing protein
MDLTDAFESLERLKDLTDEITTKEQEIRSREKMMRMATNDLNIAIWGKDTKSHFVFMNRACAEKILRTTPEAALNHPDDDFRHDELAHVCMTSDKVVQETMETHRFFEHATYKDGEYLWLDTTKSPWIVDEKLIGTVGSGRDITKFVPEDIKKKYKESGWIEIPVDSMYAKRDIRKLVERCRKSS